jgi:hypothetical protein
MSNNPRFIVDASTMVAVLPGNITNEILVRVKQ